jgi:hypothetical protein
VTLNKRIKDEGERIKSGDGQFRQSSGHFAIPIKKFGVVSGVTEANQLSTTGT